MVMTFCYEGLFSVLNQKSYSLYETCPTTEFFPVRIFLHSDWNSGKTQEFSPNTGEYGSEKNSVFGHFSRSYSAKVFCHQNADIP